jgi:hypothetical protein
LLLLSFAVAVVVPPVVLLLLLYGIELLLLKFELLVMLSLFVMFALVVGSFVCDKRANVVYTGRC